MAAPTTRTSRRLGALLADTLAVPAALDAAVETLCDDSRDVVPGAVFFARRGTRVDGERFVAAARAAGAVAVVRTGAPRVRAGPGGTVDVRVPDLAQTLGLAAARYHGSPSDRARVIGITGTNGKTSVSHFLACALGGGQGGGQGGGERGAGSCGVIGTLGHGLPGALDRAGLTTPGVITVHRLLADLVDAGCREVAMEVSSHALDQGRVAGVRFHGAVFTNLTRDHLDYHPDMAHYGAAKARLLAWPRLELAVVNRDDPFGSRLLARLDSSTRAISFGLNAMPRDDGLHLHGRLLEVDARGLALEVESPWGTGTVRAPLAGRFNALNLLAALGVTLGLGVALDDALARLARVRAVFGRMQPFAGAAGQPLVIVDYAHTPDALGKALETLREQCRGRLWCVFGCGGDRDAGKRALMGACAGTLADEVVLTDDNPRGEDGDRIVAEILRGVPAAARVSVERDRGRAICLALERAAAGDVVLVAGKGHETWQETAGVRRPFSDAAAVRAALGESAP